MCLDKVLINLKFYLFTCFSSQPSLMDGLFYFQLLMICFSNVIYAQEDTVKTKSIGMKYHYVTNWEKYRIPHKVRTNILKSVLEYVSLYRRVEYCPLENPHDCARVNVQDIVTEIIGQALKNGDEDHGKNITHTKNIANTTGEIIYTRFISAYGRSKMIFLVLITLALAKSHLTLLGNVTLHL